MESLAIGVVGSGVLLLWAAFTGRSPVDVLKAVLNGQATPAPKAPASNGGGGMRYNPNYDPNGPIGPLPSGPLLSPKQQAQVTVPADIKPLKPAPIPVASGRARGAAAGKGDQGHELVYIGQGGHKLNRAAAAAFFAAEDRIGHKILITDSYRSYATQVIAKRMKPNLAATPGTSEHEKGNAIDVNTTILNATITAALLAAGFKRFNAAKEPWHFSYGVAR